MIELSQIQKETCGLFFEGVGAIMAWVNVHAIIKHQDVKGSYWQVNIFYIMWACWDLLFIYPSLSMPIAATAAGVRLTATVIWTTIAIYYGTRGNKHGNIA